MSENSHPVHIEVCLSDIEKYLEDETSHVEIYKIVSGQRSVGAETPEIIMAVIAGGGVVIRQFILSLFDYLKSREGISLQIQVGSKNFSINYNDKSDDDKITEISNSIQGGEEKVRISKET
jgi:hypothetical protein